MFYPNKMTGAQNLSNGGNNKNNEDIGDAKGQGNVGSNDNTCADLNSKLFQEGDKFMDLLQDIVQGPLMKYWLMLQEKKL